MLEKEKFQELLQRDPVLAREILRQIEEQAERSQEPAYIEALHPKQRAFVKDPSPKKAALCSRRAGKTEGGAAWLLEGGEDSPGERSLYIALSRNNARMIMEQTLRKINERHNLGLWFRGRDNQIIVQLPNKHEIWLAGCKDTAEIEKFRGMMYRRVLIDEGASYGRFLEDLVFDVLEPALLDLQGELAIIGTPGAVPTGLFYGVTTGDGYSQSGDKFAKWPTHHWTILDNPYVPHAAEWLERKRAENKWNDKHPTYRREWLGEWVRDEGALVYPYDGTRNAFYRLPQGGKWRYSIGIDVGYEDSTAWVVGAYQWGQPELYLVHCETKQHCIPSAVAAYTERMCRTYDTQDIVIDSGGLGKGYQMEMSNRYGIWCEPAKKTEKRAYIEMLRGELMSGNVMVHPTKCGALLDEWQRLIWDEKHEAPDERFPDHLSDAALYLHRHVLTHYNPDIERKALPPEEELRIQMREHKRRCLEDNAKMMRRRMKRGQVFRDIARGL